MLTDFSETYDGLNKTSDTSNIPASQFAADVFCVDRGKVWEKYSLGQEIVTQTIGNMNETNILENAINNKWRRRSNLRGVLIKGTTLETNWRIRNPVYGGAGDAGMEGLFADIFHVLQKRINFTYSLTKPPDEKWGGRDGQKNSGWNGMIG